MREALSDPGSRDVAGAGRGFRREHRRRSVAAGQRVLLRDVVVAAVVAEDAGDPLLRPQVGDPAEAGPLEERVRVRLLPEPAGEGEPQPEPEAEGVHAAGGGVLRRDRQGVGEAAPRHGVVVRQEPVAQASGFRESAPPQPLIWALAVDVDSGDGGDLVSTTGRVLLPLIFEFSLGFFLFIFLLLLLLLLFT